jgi:hypothetical protein
MTALAPTGILRRSGTTYAGHLNVGPVQYVIDGFAKGRDVWCEFRFHRRKHADATLSHDGWVMAVTLEGFPWCITGTVTRPGEMALAGVAAAKDDDGTLGGELPF